MEDRVPRSRKSIFDPIHGVISVRGVALDLIQLPVFQRLWGIRQTGFAHLVFPGANHTRLEHSLGVYSVATSLGEALELDEPAARAVATGGLLHDLGHPPFSHTFEPTLREVLGHGHERVSREWITGARPWPERGEEGGVEALPAVLERHGVDPARVADLVDPPSSSEPRPLLRSLLHGPIDADRIDYLQRDAHYTGVAHGAIDAVRLLETARSIDGRLAFAEKGRAAVEGFLIGRALMYASVYYHKTVRAAEVMAQAALERMPGFPGAARELLAATDADVIARLRGVEGPSGRLMRGLLARRLLKRAHGWSTVDDSLRRRFEQLARHPEERRAAEDRLSARLGAPEGSVLFDLAGLDARAAPESDWAEVGLVEDGEVSFPFRAPSVWQTVAVRPPTRSLVSLYVAPSAESNARRQIEWGSVEIG